MPKKDVTLNLPGFTIKKSYDFNPIIHEVVYHRRSRCPHCKSTDLRKKDTINRDVEHETIGLRRNGIEENQSQPGNFRISLSLLGFHLKSFVLGSVQAVDMSSTSFKMRFHVT